DATRTPADGVGAQVVRGQGALRAGARHQRPDVVRGPVLDSGRVRPWRAARGATTWGARPAARSTSHRWAGTSATARPARRRCRRVAPCAAGADLRVLTGLTAN